MVVDEHSFGHKQNGRNDAKQAAGTEKVRYLFIYLNAITIII